ncbi:FliI/YscN family ATPase [Salinicola avicenniae]|uniref:FliI/YscN family ATPase n=1 Tax=Salinicola avicenniae TaxID=2916836 RepID=UPI002073A2AD|nr:MULTISPECIES: FliI/YscN family ATPase [unclassified Salinicola]
MSEDRPTLEAWYQRNLAQIALFDPLRAYGTVQQVNGTLIHSRLPSARVGELCRIQREEGGELLAEIIGFDRHAALLSALGGIEGICLNHRVEPLGHAHRVSVDDGLLGQVLDGFGRALEPGGPEAFADRHAPWATDVIGPARPATQRPRITQALSTGVRALDSTLTLGKGQRIGLFAGAGCGKTTLLAEIARNVDCDIIVFGMVGERGRELREFLDHELDASLRARAVVVCATSDCSSMERARAAFTATAIAEDYRRRGKHVLLLIDSLTRFARAQREIGLAAGEPLGRGGLPPSVYSMLPRLVERTGLAEQGAITALYTVLIEQDSMNDPVADEVRSLLDGHIVLSRKLAERGHFPAIDILASLSRTQANVVDDDHRRDGASLRRLLSAYADVELMLRLGEYEAGHQPLTDLAVESHEAIERFLRQDLRDPSPISLTLSHLAELTEHVT